MIPVIKSPKLVSLPNIAHTFASRQGGVSTGYLTSLNTSYNKGDLKENVDENCRRVCVTVDGDLTQLHTVFQNHTTDVVCLTESDQPITADCVADAIVTNLPNKILGIKTADCAPVLLADPLNQIIGAAHAGWRGALNGILENAVTAMINLGAKQEHIIAAIGPCIWQESYEVGQDMYLEFSDGQNFFKPGSRPNHWQFNLPGYVAYRLRKIGIKHVCPPAADTFSNPLRFFSYRRKTLNNEPVFGLNLSIIKLNGIP